MQQGAARGHGSHPAAAAAGTGPGASAPQWGVQGRWAPGRGGEAPHGRNPHYPSAPSQQDHPGAPSCWGHKLHAHGPGTRARGGSGSGSPCQWAAGAAADDPHGRQVGAPHVLASAPWGGGGGGGKRVGARGGRQPPTSGAGAGTCPAGGRSTGSGTAKTCASGAHRVAVRLPIHRNAHVGVRQAQQVVA